MNARYYDAGTGRFISQDSYRGEIDDAGTWHLYAYCANDPINHVDPTGHLKKRWYNKVSTVAKFIDAVVIVVGGISSAKAAKAYIKKHEKKITVFVRRKLIKEFKKSITTTYITTAISLVGHFLDTSIGKILAKALDYADKWWGYKRNNGYILN